MLIFVNNFQSVDLSRIVCTFVSPFVWPLHASTVSEWLLIISKSSLTTASLYYLF